MSVAVLIHGCGVLGCGWVGSWSFDCGHGGVLILGVLEF